MAQDIKINTSYTILGIPEELCPGILCVIADPGHKAEDVVFPGNDYRDKWCLGAAVCSKQDSSGRYSVQINGTEYKFNRNGKPASSEAMNLQCYPAKANKSPWSIGSVTGGLDRVVTTRNTDGSADIHISADEKMSVSIDNLNARDQIALKILQGFIEHIEGPAALGPDQISYYCDAAYKWASYLMTNAASTRSVIESSGEGSSESFVSTDDLTSNTEKLLNNIVVELSKNDYTEYEEEEEIKSKMISIRQFPDFVEVMQTMADVIEELKNTTSLQSEALRRISSSLNNITVHVTYTE